MWNTTYNRPDEQSPNLDLTREGFAVFGGREVASTSES
jgi:hypothetical protein